MEVKDGCGWDCKSSRWTPPPERSKRTSEAAVCTAHSKSEWGVCGFATLGIYARVAARVRACDEMRRSQRTPVALTPPKLSARRYAVVVEASAAADEASHALALPGPSGRPALETARCSDCTCALRMLEVRSKRQG